MSHHASCLTGKNCQNLQQKLHPKKTHITIWGEDSVDLFHGHAHTAIEEGLMKVKKRKKKGLHRSLNDSDSAVDISSVLMGHLGGSLQLRS